MLDKLLKRIYVHLTSIQILHIPKLLHLHFYIYLHIFLKPITYVISQECCKHIYKLKVIHLYMQLTQYQIGISNT